MRKLRAYSLGGESPLLVPDQIRESAGPATGPCPIILAGRTSIHLSDLHCRGGGKGIRTPDLLTASQALYQLSYTPEAAQRHFFLRAIPVK